jgi:hypothetical protein
MIALAAEQGVRLTETATLFALFTLGVETPRVIDQVTLPAGTVVVMVGSLEDALVSPVDPTVTLLEVRIVDDTIASGGFHIGWIDRKALENAETLAPLARGLELGANVRAGDAESFRIKGKLEPGQTAEIIALSSRQTGWFFIRLNNDVTGWVAPWAVEVLGDIGELPYYDPPELIIPATAGVPAAQVTPIPDSITQPDQPPPANTPVTTKPPRPTPGGGGYEGGK